MAKHFYQVVDEKCDYLIDAQKAQSRIETSTGKRPQIMEHLEDGSVLPHPHGFEEPKYVIGTKADEAQRIADEVWNQ